MAGKFVNKSGIPVLRDKPRGSVPLRDAIARAQIDAPELLETEGIDLATLDIGLKLKQARKVAGLTQVELAAKTGIAQSAISDIERGRGKDGPGVRVLTILSAALNVSLELASRPDPENAVYRSWLVKLDQDTDLALVDEAPNPIECVPFLRSVVEEAQFSQLILSLRNVVDAQHLHGSLCGFWKLPAHRKASLSFPAATLLVTYNGRAKISSAKHDKDNFVVLKPHEHVAVANTGDSTLSLLTIPVTPELASA